MASFARPLVIRRKVVGGFPRIFTTDLIAQLDSAGTGGMSGRG